MTETEKVTVDSILNTLTDWVENKHPIGANMWLDACMKLTLLSGDDQDTLFNLQSEIATMKIGHIDNGDSVPKAQARVEATDLYRIANKLEAKIDRITEMVRISKLQARMSDDNLRRN